MIDGNYITQQQFEEDVARLDDPDFLMPSAILWSAWGRRPMTPVRSRSDVARAAR
jgi:hypothetical protein